MRALRAGGASLGGADGKCLGGIAPRKSVVVGPRSRCCCGGESNQLQCLHAALRLVCCWWWRARISRESRARVVLEGGRCDERRARRRRGCVPPASRRASDVGVASASRDLSRSLKSSNAPGLPHDSHTHHHTLKLFPLHSTHAHTTNGARPAQRRLFSLRKRERARQLQLQKPILSPARPPANPNHHGLRGGGRRARRGAAAPAAAARRRAPVHRPGGAAAGARRDQGAPDRVGLGHDQGGGGVPPEAHAGAARAQGWVVQTPLAPTRRRSGSVPRARRRRSSLLRARPPYDTSPPPKKPQTTPTTTTQTR